MATLDEVKARLAESLQLGERATAFNVSTRLLGNIPELDSMAVVSLLTALEEHYGFEIDDDEISADMFATLGTLTQFVEDKLQRVRRS
jgi:acyl carrier protein